MRVAIMIKLLYSYFTTLYTSFLDDGDGVFDCIVSSMACCATKKLNRDYRVRKYYSS